MFQKLNKKFSIIPAKLVYNGSRYTHTKTHRVLCLAGDGVGPELVESSKQVVDCLVNHSKSALRIEFEDMPFGYSLYQSKGYAISPQHIEAFKELKIIFKGPVTIPPGDTSFYIDNLNKNYKYTSPNQALRKIFDLYANVRPAISCPIGTDAQVPFQNVNIITIRENTEDLYSGEEVCKKKKTSFFFFPPSKKKKKLRQSTNFPFFFFLKKKKKHVYDNGDRVEAIKRITRKCSERIAKFAFHYARTHHRQKVTAVHKANVNKKSDGLFLECHRACGNEPLNRKSIVYTEQLADSLLYKLMTKHSDFDVLSCPNLYGDLVSDLLGGMIGSLGLMPAAQFHAEWQTDVSLSSKDDATTHSESDQPCYRYALFEPTHGSAPDIAQQNKVNPISQWRSVVLLLEYLGDFRLSHVLETCIQQMLKDGFVTPDLKGRFSTTDMTKHILTLIDQKLSQL
ncbi:hypothetical protein RFI_08709 [Reticulomyxa filosa]|uniref:Isopropylmalate dehydrogenase-like domain-containing protein n=1 Tax=Reticulomyxa filosa TaxID=46433 RepID=X6NQ74_RETFI|nr:hypothetical protein RFI_08709 [Reticulomyxa filosa]|eukprot:ETO28425.1 hypothetical protein RFI_08709 [Reticulomyxa filosa]